MDLHKPVDFGNRTFDELSQEEKWRVEHQKMHEKHEGHDKMHAEMVMILIFTLVAAQVLLIEWKKRHYRSYSLITLIALWIIPMVLCLKNRWWRFVFIWLVFSCITGLIMQKAMRKPIKGTTPRYIHKYLLNNLLLLQEYFPFSIIRNELNQNDENNQLSKKKVQFIQENSKKTPKTLDKQKAHQDTSIQQISCNDISDSEDENQIEDQPVSNTSIEKDEDKQLDEKEVQASQGNFKRTPKTFDKGEFIKSKFLVEMPADFYQFWEYCKDLNNDDPSDALKDMSLKLVGPYDVLAGKFSDIIEPSSEQYLLHWRYYYDIPEFQTVIKGDDSSGFHIGYFRDTPNDKPVFMAKNSAEKNGEITCTGDNIFAAVL
ncbi:histone PARylation factor 1-like [Agrilus planipennis]|uniref:Histone PARylation factor 1-like n=1 Tax=Agrilus planipennis TaxID=224129 RepID=A0A7F5R575_AGRPL|nr:histone PARylation factor 1-like [Agrilus planipennis]